VSDSPPTIGQDPWGSDLNTYLASLETRLATVETRLTAVEAQPEYVYSSYSWQYSSAAPPPTGSQVRFDNVNLSLAHQAVFRLIDNDGADRTAVFQQLASGSLLRINDWNNATNIHRFRVTGPASIGASDVSVPVAWLSGNGTIPNAKANVAFIIALVL
jgi:hypothetical protein